MEDDYEWALDRVTRMCASALVDAQVYRQKLLKGFGYPNETFSRAQDYRALTIILSALQQAQARPEIETLQGLVSLLKREVKQVEDWLATLPIQQAGPVRLRDIRDILKRLEAEVAAPTRERTESSRQPEHGPFCVPTDCLCEKPAESSRQQGAENLADDRLRELWRSVTGPHAELTGPLIRFAWFVYKASKEQSASDLNWVRAQRDVAEKKLAEAHGNPSEDLVDSLHHVFTNHGIASRSDLPHALISDIASWAARKCREAGAPRERGEWQPLIDASRELNEAAEDYRIHSEVHRFTDVDRPLRLMKARDRMREILAALPSPPTPSADGSRS